MLAVTLFTIVVAAQIPADPPAPEKVDVVAAPLVVEPLAREESPTSPDVVTIAVPEEKKGTLGGVLGAAGGCAAGMGIPGAAIGGASGFLYWLFGQAAIGACVGWTPALTALGASAGICGVAVCLPMASAGAATAGAMYGAQQEGRDPVPALIGAIPGLALGTLSTGVLLVGVITAMGGIAVIQPVVIIVVVGSLMGLAAAPCAACGASIGDVIGGQAPAKVEDVPVEVAPSPMRF